MGHASVDNLRGVDDTQTNVKVLVEKLSALEALLAERTTELRSALQQVERLREQLEHGNGHQQPGTVEHLSKDGNGSSSNGSGLHTLEEVERRHFQAVLTRTRGVIEGPNGAAKMLDLKPSTARFRIRKLGIKREDFVVR